MGAPGCGYVVVPAFHIPTIQEAAAAGVCGFNGSFITPWWPCLNSLVQTNHTGVKTEMGKEKGDIWGITALPRSRGQAVG